MPNTTAALREGEAEGPWSVEGRVPADRTRTKIGVDYISERTAGQIIADSIRLYLSNFLGILLVYALPLFPPILLSASAAASGEGSLVVGFEVLKVVVAIFVSGAVTIAVSDVCLGNRLSIKRSYAELGQVFWSYLGTYLLYILALVTGGALAVLVGEVLGGLALCVSLVLPLYALMALLFSLPVCVIERRSPIDACRRSMALGTGHYLRNFGVIFLAGLVGMVMAFVIGFIMGAAGLRPMSMTYQLIVGLVGAVAGPVYLIPAILLYYDMRVRKENFDGAALAQELMT